MSSFLSLGVPAPLVSVLEATGRTEPFPIQRDTLPDSLAGRDVLGRGRTGSGKTLAFSLPLVARLSGAKAAARRPGRPRGLVLCPTRELATQIAATITPLAEAAGLRVTTIFGGVSQRPQEQAMRAGVDIVVACPGRLEDLMKQGVVTLDTVEITVLDEADHMADLGFLPGVTRILKATPAGGQRLLFSATLDRGVDGLVRSFLRDEVRHSVDESSVPAAAMTHRVLLVADDHKASLVETLASGVGRRILFTRTKHQAKKLARQLTARGIPAVDLHGNLGQGARERNLAAFGADPAAGGVRVLVATDVAARGVHVDEVELVVHVDPPLEHKAYLHRSGRTARAGAEGTVVTVVLASQKRDVADMLRKAAITAPFENVDADTPAVRDLVGETAARVAPSAAPAAAAQKPKTQPQKAKPQGGSQPAAGQGGSRGRRSSGGTSGAGRADAATPRSGEGRPARGGQGQAQGQRSTQGQRAPGHGGTGQARHGGANGAAHPHGGRPAASDGTAARPAGARRHRRASRP
ncbi:MULTISPECIES: DEAD/DEAH box helicase [Microbacterium]|uniref:DEAD/DEAH box helicase n=1 Tax=Microbacterium TaxID=33882 RepID=UPI0010F8F1E2|nr:DEAD/DEAH box helicase [Microbacterium sp. 4NA327F11]MCK9913384.1 DEAD/DEAH box helicase [Microbacteriaceae bacterium K1510]